MSDLVQHASGHPDVGVIVASRSERSFETFPPIQLHAERLINHLCGELIGTHGNYSYGPFLMNRALVPMISVLGQEVGWGWRPFIFLTAHLRGKRVLRVVDDYSCPLDQIDEGKVERAHPLRQLSQNILGLIASTTQTG